MPSRSTFRASAAFALALAATPLARAAPAQPIAQPISLAAPRDFDAAVVAVEGAAGAKGEAATLGGAAVPLSEGRAFRVEGATAERLLAGSHAAFRSAGFYLFRLERAFGLGGDKDVLVLLRTADRSAVVRRVGTSGPKAGATTDAIVAWLDRLAKDEPFELTEVGVDYLAGQFARSPRDPAAVARRCVEIAPELVSGRSENMLRLLEEEIRADRTLYLIW